MITCAALGRTEEELLSQGVRRHEIDRLTAARLAQEERLWKNLGALLRAVMGKRP